MVKTLEDQDKALSLIIIGASGDLARKKVIPALFALYCQGRLPERFQVVGFARTPMPDEAFRKLIAEHLTCRCQEGPPSSHSVADFLERCIYIPGEYSSRDAFLDMYARMREAEGPGAANRLFYMAIPPFLFEDVAHALGGAGLVNCEGDEGWSRAVVEKPFGRDRASSDKLVASMVRVFHENQTFRIDHYLGKEVVQNILVLRFANAVFDPIWNRECVDSVRISWKEDLGLGGRGGYFDEYGIIRDVVQNHLLQILALTAMERPRSLSARHIRDEKVRVLRSIRPIDMKDFALGQYSAGSHQGTQHPAYVDDAAVPENSTTPTFAATVLYVQTPRWRGVPFLLSAGKGLDERLAEIRIRFKKAPGGLFSHVSGGQKANELVIRVQPDESIYLNIVNKKPGLEMDLAETALHLRYGSAFAMEIPDAYECLLLDVLRGDGSLFIREDELATAWDIFTPALHLMESKGLRPHPYPFGGTGPEAMRALAARHKVEL